MSVFSTYSIVTGNAKDWTGIIVSPDDAAVLQRHGFEVHGAIGARGMVGEDGSAEFELSQDLASDRLRVYDSARGKLIFAIAPHAVRLRTAAGERSLNRRDDLSIGHLRAVERNGRLFLVSTPRSALRASKKRNTKARRPASRRAREQGLSLKSQTLHGSPVPGLVAKWGDDLAVRLPQEIIASAGLGEGSRIEIEASDDGRVIIAKSRRHFTLDELLAGMTPEREHALEDDGPRGGEII